MTMQWVRDTYHVPAKRGRRVEFDGRPGRILSATHHLRVRLDDGHTVRAHPTWRMRYLNDGVRDG